MADISAAQYKKTYNPIVHEDQIMFDLFDQVELYMKINNINHGEELYRYIWTVVDGDSGDLVIINGFHFCNRVGYVLCTNPWGSGEISDRNIYIEAEY